MRQASSLSQRERTHERRLAIPDSYGFNHEPHHGRMFHRCIECDEYPFGVFVSETERKRHHAKHERDRQRQLERTRKANLRLARRTKRQIERENG